MLITRISLTGLLWNVIFVPLLLAQKEDIPFEHLSLQEGLSQSTVLCAAEDSRGFMWFGTRHGINRYDGYSFKVYSYSPDDSHSLSDNWVTTILEDSAHNLWVGTHNGLNRLSLGHWLDIDDGGNSFVRYKHRRDQLSGLSSNVISKIYEDKFGRLWVGTADGLNYYDRQQDSFQLFPLVDTTGAAVTAAVTAMIHDRHNRLWLGTAGAGLFVLNQQYNVVKQYKTSQDIYQLRYSQSVQKAVRRMTSKSPLAAIRRPGEQVDAQKRLQLTRETQLLVVAMGEGLRAFTDFASIEMDGNLVWLMNFADSRFAGGSLRNRIQVAALSLPPGDYSLHYRSDRGHSYGHWHFAAPYQPDLWGVQVFEITPEDLTFLQSLSDSTATVLSGNTISSLLEDANGDIWIGTNVTGLNKFDRSTGRFYHYLGQPPLPGRSHLITGLIEEDSGTIWATSDLGLWRIDSDTGRAKRYFHDDRNEKSLTTDNISCATLDSGGNVWIGTILGGINMYSRHRQKFEDFQDHVHLPEEVRCRKLTYSFAEDSRGLMWVGSACGLELLDPEKGRFISPLALPEVVRSLKSSVYSMKFDRNGALWLGTNGDGIWRFPDFSDYFDSPFRQTGGPAEPDHFVFTGDQASGLSSNLVWSIFEDSDGDIWVGTKGGGLNHFNPATNAFSSSSNDRKSASIRRGWIRTIFEDRDGNLWLGTEGRGLNLYRKQTGVLRTYLTVEADSTSLSHNNVTAIYQDSLGALWVATYGGGLNRFDGENGEFMRFTERDGLPNNVVYGILPDDDGHLWLSTNGGLCMFDPAAEVFKTFDVQDGLQSNEFNSGAFFRSRVGDLYFGGVNGFNRVRPADVRSNTHAPRVVITAVRVLERRANLDSAKIRLNHKQNFISFEFVGLDFTNPKRNTYAYKLEGLDEHWKNCGNRRYANYTNLAPGSYTFKVRCANNDGLWSKTEARFVVIVEPPFWQARWFVLSAVLGVVGLGFFLHNYRVRAKVREVVAVERVRKKAAADFHDELGHKLTKISLFSELVKRSLTAGGTEADDYLGRIAGLSNSLYDGMRDFLWTLDPGKDSLYELAIRLKDFGDEFFDKTGIEFRVAGVTGALQRVQLSMDQKRHATLIFKEVMNNSLRHADCQRVKLEFVLTERAVTVAVTDNGVGFDPDKVCFGNGLQNMLRRAEEVRSSIRVHTAPGSGCRIALVMDI